MRTMIAMWAVHTALLLSSCLATQHERSEASFAVQQAKPHLVTDGFFTVVKVIDGDTFWVADDNGRFKVRFIGIDAPETRNTRWKQKGPLAKEAKNFVKQLTDNKRVRLELDVQKKDRYERILAYIYLADGTFLNAELVKKGYAVVDTYPPNVKYVDLFVEMQQEAKAKRLGVWHE